VLSFFDMKKKWLLLVVRCNSTGWVTHILEHFRKSHLTLHQEQNIAVPIIKNSHSWSALTFTVAVQNRLRL